VRTRALRLAALIALPLALAATSCKRTPPQRTPEEVAYQFRDVMPYAGVTEGADAERLSPLVSAYLTYISAKDFDAAAQQFEAVARRHPDMTEARLLQGISLVLAERPTDAVGPLESVVKDTPRSGAAHWWLAKALFQTNRRDEALAHVRQVADLGGPYTAEAQRVLEVVPPPS
jgi:thioredoxin-like negative regulator of GroEL